MRSIGIDVEPPKRSCEDPLCPFHGSLRVRGRMFRGKTVSVGGRRTAVIQREYLRFLKKYMRYEKRRSKIHAHIPPCISVDEGDYVNVGECRPLAKTISFVILGKVRK